MSRIFITGSTDGLGYAAARVLIEDGHEVVLHARTRDRASAIDDLAPRAVDIVIGDLSSSVETHQLADQVNAIGRVDAVIHNAGIYRVPSRSVTPEGHARTLAVNTLAPYMLTALIEGPGRLVYLSSGMHLGARPQLRDIDWLERRWDQTEPYCESKLYVTALALAIARLWPDILSNVVDPGWVPTKMGGAGAPDDFEMGYLTQTWLAVSDDPSARVSGGYWHHRQQQRPALEASDSHFQDQLLTTLAKLTGVALFQSLLLTQGATAAACTVALIGGLAYVRLGIGRHARIQGERHPYLPHVIARSAVAPSPVGAPTRLRRQR